MSEKFLPDPQQLPQVEKLISLTEVTENNLEDAIADWKNKPPDDDFKLIIEAEIED